MSGGMDDGYSDGEGFHCHRCGDKFTPITELDHYCPNCTAELWADWEDRHKDEIEEVKQYQKNGHPYHCACRMVWGDGECECDLYKKGYNPDAWMNWAEL